MVVIILKGKVKENSYVRDFSDTDTATNFDTLKGVEKTFKDNDCRIFRDKDMVVLVGRYNVTVFTLDKLSKQRRMSCCQGNHSWLVSRSRLRSYRVCAICGQEEDLK